MSHIFDCFLDFDLSVFQWIQGIHNNIIDALTKGITTLGNGGCHAYFGMYGAQKGDGTPQNL